jgi:hypothetical protein
MWDQQSHIYAYYLLYTIRFFVITLPVKSEGVLE